MFCDIKDKIRVVKPILIDCHWCMIIYSNKKDIQYINIEKFNI